jgi:mycofactocin glycosyltransferase
VTDPFAEPAPPPAERALPMGTAIRLDPRTKLWAGGAVLIGGSPWRISRLAPRSQTIVVELEACGARGRSAQDAHDLAVFRELVDRGFAHVVATRDRVQGRVATVIPAMDRPELLNRCLGSLDSDNTVVVDDGSVEPAAVAAVARRFRSRLDVHPVNLGPAAARNTGLRFSDAEFVAFIDSDCVAPAGWPESMLHHFADPMVAAVAPRVVGREVSGGVIERYERTRSSLDMGVNTELVRPGSRLGFVPSAALILRRSALADAGFDERMRVGEDVDLVWRLAEAGWHVIYDPSMLVEHEIRAEPRQWLQRRYEYGTSAPALEQRHPGRLAPARVSAWNLASLALLAARKPLPALAVSGAAALALNRKTRSMPAGSLLAGRVVGQGLLADGAAIGHLLRREWWPIGAAALALSPRSSAARLAATTMLAPIALEWISRERSLDPVRYTALRLLDDASYGTGVIAASLRARNWRTLTPHVRFPLPTRVSVARLLKQ